MRLTAEQLPALTIAGRSLRLRLAAGFLTRARGLLAAPQLADDEALLIVPCAAVHTIGMGYVIDVLFLDGDARVRRVTDRVAPWRALACAGTRAVLEMASGGAERYGLTAGTHLAALAPWLGPRRQADQRLPQTTEDGK